MEGRLVLPRPVIEQRRSLSSSYRRPKSPDANDPTIVTVKGFFLQEIEEQRAVVPLAGYCFMTGFLNAVCFSAIFAWCASQTGNTIQLSIAIGRLLDKQPDYLYRGFVGRIGERVGYSTRIWLVCGTLLQALLTMGAAIALWKSHIPWYAAPGSGPIWTSALAFLGYGFMSASMGLQGVMAKRLNTQFSTSVVLTSIWCELISEPKLFHLRRGIVERDHKFLTIFCMLLGGFSGRCVLDDVGPAITLGIAAGLRLVISGWWLLVPKKIERKFNGENDDGFQK